MGKKLYVGNLPFSTTEDTLHEWFSQCGSVDSARVISDRESGRSKGFGFVEMSNDDEAQQAITSFDGKEMDGRQIVVNEARPMERRESGSSYGASSGGGGGWQRSGGESQSGFSGGRSRY